MVLQTCLQKSAIAIDDDVDYKQQIVTHVVSNEEVLFHWSISLVYIMDECASAELLKKIVELWLTIHGFSMAKQWMEHNSQKFPFSVSFCSLLVTKVSLR